MKNLPLRDHHLGITHPEARRHEPVVLHFRRALELGEVPASLPVEVTADNRFVLFVNGRRVASGPSAGTLEQWRVSRVDLAPWLHAGRNVLAATVWNFGEAAPLSQQILATGFRLLGGPGPTSQPGWRVRIDAGRSATPGREQIPWQVYSVQVSSFP